MRRGVRGGVVSRTIVDEVVTGGEYMPSNETMAVSLTGSGVLEAGFMLLLSPKEDFVWVVGPDILSLGAFACM